MKNTITKIAVLLSVFLPNISFAALSGLKDLIKDFGGILKTTIPILVGLSVVYFFWGIGQFILHAGDQKMRDDGKKKIMWGVIALFVMVSIWGIIAFLGGILGIETGTTTTGSSATPCPPGTINIGDGCAPGN